mgnify:CR=1 FL=1
MLLPEPTYKGPESIVYFRGNTMAEELQRDTKVGLTHGAVHRACIFLPTFFLRLRYTATEGIIKTEGWF